MSLFPEGEHHLQPEVAPEQRISSYYEQRLHLLPTTFNKLTEGLSQEGDLERYRDKLASLCRNPAEVLEIHAEIDTITRQETIDTLQNGIPAMDCLVIGTGPAGVSFSSKLRQLHPHARLWMADDRDYRGGQFADEGLDFKLNTPKEGPLGFAGELPHPNHLGDAAFLQIGDISYRQEDYYRRRDLVTCLKIDGFMAAPALVGVKVVSVERDSDEQYSVKAVHKDTGEELAIHPNIVVFARGRGKPKYGLDLTSVDTQEAIVTRGSKIYVSEAFNNYIDGLPAEEVLSVVKDRLAVIGAGDSANTALEAILNKLLTTVTPDQIQQLHIDLYGAKYADVQQFIEDVRIPRYDALQPYIGNLIRPHNDKATELLSMGKNSIGVRTASSLGVYKTIAMMTGYQQPPIEDMVNIPGGARLIDITGEKELEGEVIAQQIIGERVFRVGIDVKETFPGRPPVYTNSLVRTTPRVLATAEKVAALLTSH